MTADAGPVPGADQLDGRRYGPAAGLTLPGFANAHSHAFHRALRGITQASRGTFWTWRERMYEVAARLDPDSYLALARAVYAEMTLAGVCCVGEFHYLHHGPGGVRVRGPERHGQGAAAGRRGGGPADQLAGHLLSGGRPRPRTACRRNWRDRSCASATATERSGPAGSPRLGADAGPRRARRRRDPLGAGRPAGADAGGDRLVAPARRAAARAPVGAGGREHRLPGGLRPDAGAACCSTPARSGRARAWCTPPTSRPATSACSARARATPASARRPRRTSPTASARPGRSRPRAAR